MQVKKLLFLLEEVWLMDQKDSSYKVKKINKKVRKLALAQTLSKKNSDKNLHF